MVVNFAVLAMNYQLYCGFINSFVRTFKLNGLSACDDSNDVLFIVFC